MVNRVVAACLLASVALGCLPIMYGAGSALWRDGGVGDRVCLVLSSLGALGLLTTGFAVIWTH